jgi:hypothetical protein
VAASDPEILGGEPVFRGTRVPVHLIATPEEQVLNRERYPNDAGYVASCGDQLILREGVAIRITARFLKI